MRFTVQDDVFDALGPACFGVVVVSGIDNSAPNPKVGALLTESVSECTAALADTDVRAHPSVARYREAFTAMGINPNKFQCSIEALLSRIAKGKGMPSINTVVDLGNAVSLRHRVPIGAHDIDSTAGELGIRLARTGDEFIPFGATEPEEVAPDEVVYAAGSSVRTRRWIWRQSETGKIGAHSTNILFPIDGFSDANEAAVRAAQHDLATTLRELGDWQVDTGWVDTHTRAISL